MILLFHVIENSHEVLSVWTMPTSISNIINSISNAHGLLQESLAFKEVFTVKNGVYSIHSWWYHKPV